MRARESSANNGYRRSYYRRCLQKKGWTQWLPVDLGNNAHLKDKAQKLYEQIYVNFARFVFPPRLHCIMIFQAHLT